MSPDWARKENLGGDCPTPNPSSTPPAKPTGCLPPPSLAEGFSEEPDSPPNTPTRHRVAGSHLSPSLLGQDKSVTLRLTPWPAWLSRLPSITPHLLGLIPGFLVRLALFITAKWAPYQASHSGTPLYRKNLCKLLQNLAAVEVLPSGSWWALGRLGLQEFLHHHLVGRPGGVIKGQRRNTRHGPSPKKKKPFKHHQLRPP